MNKLTIFLFLLSLIACKQEAKKETSEAPGAKAQERMKSETVYPDALAQVFDAHGGLNQWKAQLTLSYVIPKPNLSETHTIDLWSRKDRIDTEQFSMGFDGEQAWLMNGSGEYEGDVGFYHNLMFYFYAMPFVLADDGIVYSATPDLEYEGKKYPGIQIGYKSGVGASSKDEYFIYFDPETYQMAWLGYTVTYRSGESSDNVKWINYGDWQEVSGLMLPKTITWHKYEGRTILEPVSSVTFEEVTVDGKSKPDAFYAKPEAGEYVTIQMN